MDRDWLEGELSAGRSIESIARETGRHPSTVGYWVRKHGLRSTHADRHAGREGIAREELAALVAEGLPIRAMADRLEVSYATARHWLRVHGLRTAWKTEQDRRKAARAAAQSRVAGVCRIHGEVPAGDPLEALSLRTVRARGGRRPPPDDQGDPRRRSRRRLHAVRLRRGAGRAALPSSRPGRESLRARRPRYVPVARASPRGSGQVRAPLRELPRRGRVGGP